MRGGLSRAEALRLTPVEIAMAIQATNERWEDEHRLRLAEGWRLLVLERTERPPRTLAEFLDPAPRFRAITDPDERARLMEEHARRVRLTREPGDLGAE